MLGPRRDNCLQVSLADADPNCASLAQLEQPQCSVCQVGYFLSADACAPCSKFSLDKGCLNCNADDTACLVCKPGFTMDNSGKCA